MGSSANASEPRPPQRPLFRARQGDGSRLLQTAPTARRGRERQGTLPTTDRARNRTATPSQHPFSAREGSPEGRRRRGGGEGEQWKHFRTPLAATVLSALGGSQTVPPEKETAKRKTSRKGSNAPFRLADLSNGTKATGQPRGEQATKGSSGNASANPAATSLFRPGRLAKRRHRRRKSEGKQLQRFR